MSADTLEESPFFPSREVPSGADFIRSIPEVVDALVRSRDNEADRLILVERLTKLPQERKTLDRVAANTKLTRERIRQRESKLISLLVNAFLHGRTQRLGFGLRPDFIAHWATAAGWFGTREEIRFSDFLAGLQSAWSVSAQELMPQLPLITVVLTSRATIPEQLRQQMRFDPRYFVDFSPESRAIPLKSLALGRAFEVLFADGIECVGDLFDLARSGRLPVPTTSLGGCIDRVLKALLNARRDDGSVDWHKYEDAIGLVRLPQSDHSSIEEFLDALKVDLESIVSANNYSKRAADVFRMRVSAPRSRRPTLAETADALGTHGPVIKREESLLLAGLNDQLIDRDFSSSRVAFRMSYLNHWKWVEELYRSSGPNFATFARNLTERVGLSGGLRDGSAELLWAVLNQYPAGRPRRATPRKASRDTDANSASDGIIVLRGFRSVH